MLVGGSQKLSALRGKAVMINFWATWCPPCKEEMPLFERYSQKYSGGLVLLGIDSGEDAAQVRSFINGMDLTYPILLDLEGDAVSQYYAKNLPSTFFVDSQGILRGQHLGLLTEDLLVEYLKTIGIAP
jgi:cytochrome c biogenesis protein CcmG, thiol:disulfide interchange protein DsbE